MNVRTPFTVVLFLLPTKYYIVEGYNTLKSRWYESS